MLDDQSLDAVIPMLGHVQNSPVVRGVGTYVPLPSYRESDANGSLACPKLWGPFTVGLDKPCSGRAESALNDDHRRRLRHKQNGRFQMAPADVTVNKR